MAKAGQQEIDELFISLGLDIAQLQLDFDTAGKTVSQAIQKLNSSGNKIRLQMETDLSRLDGVGSELDKIRVKYEAINKQLDLQRQKESILAAVLKDAQKNYGADNYVTRKAETDLLRQQKLIAQTEAELRKLAQAKIAAQGTIQLNVNGEKVKTALSNIQDSIARANAKIQNIRLKAEIDLSALRGVNSALEAERISAQALNRELDLQQQKLRQLQNAYNVSNKNYGGNNLVTLNAQSNVLRQVQEIEKLQAKIREISNAKADIKIDANTQQTESYLVQGVNKMKAQVDAGVAKINESLSRIGANARKSLDLKITGLNSIPAVQNLTSGLRRANIELSAVGNYASAGFGKVTAGAKAAKNAVSSFVNGVNQINAAVATGTSAVTGAMGLFKLSEGAVKAGHDTYVLSQRLQTSTAEAGQLKRMFGQVDAEPTMMIPIFMRLTKQFLSAGETGNALTEAMQNYDFRLTDSEGRMLSYTQILEQLAKSFSDLKTIVDSLALLPNSGMANPSSQAAHQNFIKQGDQQPQNYSDLGQISMPYQSEKITKYWEPTSLTFDDALKRLSQVPLYTPVDFDKGSAIRGKYGDVYGTSNLVTNDITEFKQRLSEDFFTTNSTALNGFYQQTQDITEKLANLGAAIENLSLTPDKKQPQYYSDSGNNSSKQPANVNVTVQIEEAHAWDSEHIQELTDKVADKITPALEQALGSDSNSY